MFILRFIGLDLASPVTALCRWIAKCQFRLMHGAFGLIGRLGKGLPLFVLRNRPDEVNAMSDREVVTAWLMICPKSQKEVDGTVKPPTEPGIQVELSKPGRVAELRSRLSNRSWLSRQLSQYMGIRRNTEDEIRGHFWDLVSA